MILSAVIARLGAMFSTAVGNGATVFDGPYPPAVNKGDFVLVGSIGDDTEDGAAVDLQLSDLGPGTWVDENGEIVCASWSWSGGTDLAARRASAEANAAACVSAVYADRTLGGLLKAPGLAVCTALRYQPRQTNEGAIVRFTWSVLYQHVNT